MGITKKYLDFFKSKYDVGRINIESQCVFIKSDLPISLRPYRTSLLEEKNSNQIQSLFAAGLIKESDIPYSAPGSLVIKCDEVRKARLCVHYRKLNEHLG